MISLGCFYTLSYSIGSTLAFSLSALQPIPFSYIIDNSYYFFLEYHYKQCNNLLIVYPAHGAGSACGKNMMKETVDSLGNQKKMNYALNQPNKEAFVKAVTEGLLAPPGYFGLNIAMNKQGYESFETVLNNGMRSLAPDEFEAAAENTDALILDTRSNLIFYTVASSPSSNSPNKFSRNTFRCSICSFQKSRSSKTRVAPL